MSANGISILNSWLLEKHVVVIISSKKKILAMLLIYAFNDLIMALMNLNVIYGNIFHGVNLLFYHFHVSSLLSPNIHIYT